MNWALMMPREASLTNSYIHWENYYSISFQIEWDMIVCDSFPFDFAPNGNLFGTKSEGKLSPWSYPIQFERKWNSSFLSMRLIAVILDHFRFFFFQFLLHGYHSESFTRSHSFHHIITTHLSNQPHHLISYHLFHQPHHVWYNLSTSDRCCFSILISSEFQPAEKQKQILAEKHIANNICLCSRNIDK